VAGEALIELRDVSVVYRGRHAWGSEGTAALTGFSLSIAEGEMVGLVGESGSGKTTAGNVIAGLVGAAQGDVLWEGSRLTTARRRKLRGQLQLVGQNPRWGLDPQRRVGTSVAEPLAVLGIGTRRGRRAAAEELLAAVGLGRAIVSRYPHQLSGGQAQRAVIARALISNPRVIVFDEVVSALDVSVQVQVMNLIRDLQQEHRFAGLFISHDLAAVRYAADRVAVLYQGYTQHVADSATFYVAPLHPYSRILLSSVARIPDESQFDDAAPEVRAAVVGCPLSDVCPYAVERCKRERPELRQIGSEWAACHRAEDMASTVSATS